MEPHEIQVKHCPSCKEDFYNGHNSFGIEKCWNLKDAKLIWGKVIGISERPPYDQIPNERKPNCWVKKGFVFLRMESQ